MFKVVSNPDMDENSTSLVFPSKEMRYPKSRHKTMLLLVTVGLALYGAGYCHGSLTVGACIRTAGAGPSSLHSLQPTNWVFDRSKVI